MKPFSKSLWISPAASGAVAPAQAYDIAGTSEAVGLITRRRAAVDRLVSVVWGEATHQIGGPTQVGADSAAWCHETFRVRGRLAQAVERVGRVAPSMDLPLLLPYLAGERVPLWRSDIRGAFHGVSREHARIRAGGRGRLDGARPLRARARSERERPVARAARGERDREAALGGRHADGDRRRIGFDGRLGDRRVGDGRLGDRFARNGRHERCFVRARHGWRDRWHAEQRLLTQRVGSRWNDERRACWRRRRLRRGCERGLGWSRLGRRWLRTLRPNGSNAEQRLLA